MVKSTIDRIVGIVKSNVNELLDQIENPEKMVRQMIRDMDEAVDEAVATMCTAVANQRRLEREHANNTAKAGEFKQKAERAVASGDDELGRLYLERKTQYDRTAEDQGSALAESRRTADKLRDNLQSLRAKLQDARNRQGTLVARCQAARARGSLIAKSPSTSGSDPFSRFGQLEQRIAASKGERREHRGLPGPLPGRLTHLPDIVPLNPVGFANLRPCLAGIGHPVDRGLLQILSGETMHRLYAQEVVDRR